MNQREDYGQIGTAAFIGSMIGASLFVAGMALIALFLSESYTEASTTIAIALFALPMGWMIAMITAWPVGAVIGWLLGRLGPSTGASSAASGALTGFVLLTAIALLDGRPLSEVSPAEWLFLTGFTSLGAISGWLAYRLVLRPKPASA